MWVREGEQYKRLVYVGPQKSEEWTKARKYRVTGSRVNAALGNSKFKTAEDMTKIILGEAQEETNEAMLHGIKYEEWVRRWYERKTGNEVKEIGFAFLIDRPYVGVSPDGLVGEDGLIEIKCPVKMYYPLERKSSGKKTFYNEDGCPSHIYPSHYDQMQMQMAIMERKWCDYIVAEIIEDREDVRIYKERIPFNEEYWNSLFEKINSYIEEKIQGALCYIPSEELIIDK
jgi:putative phage-type endonuclease